ncbi:MAG TPA: serine hydrolase domain-containing protein, partial [Candidatus Eremiobacteraceae bacterium]|nr:serine hydrolase domain-containing protein [Candidatus Eremiobacteraceae bacterium]
AVVENQRLPGLSIAVARHGAILYARGFGYSDLARKTPADAHTIYNIASCSKQFTAAAIMLLVQDGAVRLDDRLSRYFPWYRHARSITVRELLNHTSGIPDYTELDDVPHHASARAFFDLVAAAPLEFTPGTRFRYSNTNYVALGMIVESASGESYSTFLRRRIFVPLDMTESATRVIPQSLPDGAVGYTLDGTKVVPMPQTPDDLGYGDGTVNASVIDLVKWDAALDDGRVVNPASWRAMTSAALPEWPGSDVGYGFGLDIGELYGVRQVSHYGLNPGYATYNATYPGEGLEIVAISNGDQFSQTWLEQRIFALLHGDTPAMRAEALQPAAGENPAMTARASEWLSRMQAGRIDASQLAAPLATDLTSARAQELLVEAGASGPLRRLQFIWEAYRASQTDYEYFAYYDHAIVDFTMTVDAHGKISALSPARGD